jgi:hypothetical protein
MWSEMTRYAGAGALVLGTTWVIAWLAGSTNTGAPGGAFAIRYQPPPQPAGLSIPIVTATSAGDIGIALPVENVVVGVPPPDNTKISERCRYSAAANVKAMQTDKVVTVCLSDAARRILLSGKQGSP